MPMPTTTPTNTATPSDTLRPCEERLTGPLTAGELHALGMPSALYEFACTCMDAVTVHFSRIVFALDGEIQPTAIEAGIGQRENASFNHRSPPDSLIFLHEFDGEGLSIGVGDRPRAPHAGRYDPLVDVAAVDDNRFVRRPVSHVKCVGDNTRAGTQIF